MSEVDYNAIARRFLQQVCEHMKLVLKFVIIITTFVIIITNN